MTQNSTYDIVIFGDSRVYRGLDPETISKNTQKSAYNFGFSSAGYSPQILNWVHNHCDSNSIIILGVTSLSLTPSSLSNKFYRQEQKRSAYQVYQRLNIDSYLSPFSRLTLDDLYPNPYQVTQKFHSKSGWVESDAQTDRIENGIHDNQHVFDQNMVTDSSTQFLLKQVNK